MRPELVNQLAQYGLASVGLMACLWLFLAFRFTVRTAWRKGEQSKEEMVRQLQAMELQVQQLREKVTQVEERPAAAAGPALNLTKRAQVLRMHRRGESVQTIAAALRSPRNEIELLLKLQQMASGRMDRAS